MAGKWTNGQAEFEANKYLLDVLSPPEEEEEPNKGKGKPPAKGAAPVEEDVFLNDKRIKIDVQNPDEAKRKLGIAIKVVFQGPDYEDPNPPEKDPNDAKKKGKNEPVEPEIRMITPEPMTMVNENGRLFEFQLGRFERISLSKDKSSLEDATANNPSRTDDHRFSQQEVDHQNSNEQIEAEKVWVQYKLDQSRDEVALYIPTDKGEIQVNDIVFKLDDHLKAGMYEIVITDITQGLDESKKMPETRIDLKLFDSVADAEAAAALLQAGKGGKKK